MRHWRRTLFLAVAGLASSLGLGASARASAILFLEQTNLSRPAYVAYMQAFSPRVRAVLAQRPEIYTENLDLGRFDGAEYRRNLDRWLREKYAATKIDVVVVSGRVATHFARELRDTLWPDATLVFGALTLADAATFSAWPNATGILIEFDAGRTMEAALLVVPDALHVVYVDGARHTFPENAARSRRAVSAFAARRGLELIEFVGLTLAETKRGLAELPPRSIVYYGAVSVDGAGRAYVPQEVLAELAAVSAAPIFGDTDTFIGHGMTGGACLGMEALGVEMADIVGGVLRSGPATTGPSPVRRTEAFHVVFDARELQRFGLDARSIPGVEVRFNKPTLLETNLTAVIWGSGALVLQTGLIVALFLQRRRRQRAEHEVLDQRDQIAHAGRVSVLGQLASSLAHELNQPLAAILRNAEAAEIFLCASPPDLEELRAILADIRSDDQRASAVIDRMRALLQRRDLDSRPLELGALVDEVISLARSDAMAKKVTVEVDIPFGFPRIRGDRVHLQQVLLNLLVNAFQALEGSAERRVVVQGRVVGGTMAEISVSDTGGGIPRADQPRLFEPFFTTKVKGLGMGLPICRTIIEAHGGVLWAGDSGNAPGASFYFTLLLAGDPAPTRAPRVPSPARAPAAAR